MTASTTTSADSTAAALLGVVRMACFLAKSFRRSSCGSEAMIYPGAKVPEWMSPRMRPSAMLPTPTNATVPPSLSKGVIQKGRV